MKVVLLGMCKAKSLFLGMGKVMLLLLYFFKGRVMKLLGMGWKVFPLGMCMAKLIFLGKGKAMLHLLGMCNMCQLLLLLCIFKVKAM